MSSKFFTLFILLVALLSMTVITLSKSAVSVNLKDFPARHAADAAPSPNVLQVNPLVVPPIPLQHYAMTPKSNLVPPPPPVLESFVGQ